MANNILRYHHHQRAMGGTNVFICLHCLFRLSSIEYLCIQNLSRGNYASSCFMLIFHAHQSEFECSTYILVYILAIKTVRFFIWNQWKLNSQTCLCGQSFWFPSSFNFADVHGHGPISIHGYFQTHGDEAQHVRLIPKGLLQALITRATELTIYMRLTTRTFLIDVSVPGVINVDSHSRIVTRISSSVTREKLHDQSPWQDTGHIGDRRYRKLQLITFTAVIVDR